METTLITNDLLVLNTYPAKRGHVTLTGVAVEEGQLLGMITASGKYEDCDSAHATGSQTVRAIALEAADATLADVDLPVLFAGAVNEGALVFSGTDTIATHRAALHDTGIYPEVVMDP